MWTKHMKQIQIQSWMSERLIFLTSSGWIEGYIHFWAWRILYSVFFFPFTKDMSQKEYMTSRHFGEIDPPYMNSDTESKWHTQDSFGTINFSF